MYSVAILMSTFNGCLFLREQIESILNQKNVDVQLYVRDDGSSDETINILEEYSKKYSNVSYYVGENKRSCKSFLELLYKDYSADFFAFADQDDVWMDDKLISGINQIRNQKENIPVLYYSNLNIVDEHLNFTRLSHSSPLVQKYRFSPLIENLATGCTIIFNRKMYELANKFKVQSFSMHDSYLFALASIFGKTIYDFTPHILYRQHAGNVIGTVLKRNFFTLIKEYKERFVRLFDRNLQPCYNNTVELWNSCGKNLPEDYRKICMHILNYKKSFLCKLKLLLDKEFRPNRFQKYLSSRILILLEIV